ncbi:MAG: hypothetical protein OEV64_15615, partial [Desulfobulbaceae bacterium]|nr:hypothetical protein [Desulfobulbaceae bacterium]
LSAYNEIWSRLEWLVKLVIPDEDRQRYLLTLLSIKFQHESASRVLLPSRLEKRLVGIFTTISEIPRPLAGGQALDNQRADDFLNSPQFHELYNSMEGMELSKAESLDDVDLHLHLLRLKRLLLLSSVRDIWREEMVPGTEYLRSILDSAIDSPDWQWLHDWLRKVLLGESRPYILWIGGRSGEIIFDLAIIQLLIKMGVRVILAVKQSFVYKRISFSDTLEDPVLERLLAKADFIGEPRISKNELLRRMHKESKLLIVSDGTGEQFNPLLTSVTFARAFKECDLVVSRCPASRVCLGNHFQFTRDFLSIVTEGPGKIDVFRKPQHPAVIRFAEHMLREKAESLIIMAKKNKEKGKVIMFYSAIVGSIPGQLETAKKILNVFIKHLRATLPGVVMINPGEHFEEGMDADDIMYMWEIFQRSGMIDLWRFQTVEDIEKSFELMGESVPLEWTGKDATFSTGCTKEMEIAMDMQKKNPEMQLIGPSWEKFLRRKEYGVGKLFDRTLAEYA